MKCLRFAGTVVLASMLGSGVAQGAELQSGQVIKVCGQAQEWPPYLFFRREQSAKTAEVVGYSAETLKRSLARKGLSYTIDMIPWRRCMEFVKTGVYDMMTDVSTNENRDRDYLVSQPYYAMHLVYFYDKDRPKPDVQSAADLKKFRVCGVNGYNYAPFGLVPADMDVGSQSLTQSYQKLKLNRCDVMTERLEIALGYKFLEVADFEKQNIGVEPVPNLPLSAFHMMVSRNVSYGNELLKLLNEGIESLKKSGEATGLANKYSIPGVKPTLVPTKTNNSH